MPGFLGLTYVQNTGAAFSSLEGMRWLFVAVFAVLTVLLLVEYFKKPMPFTKLERWCIAAIYAGGLGNIIDRIRIEYVGNDNAAYQLIAQQIEDDAQHTCHKEFAYDGPAYPLALRLNE